MTTLSIRLTRALICLVALGVVPACGPAKGPTTPPPTFSPGITAVTSSVATPGQITLTWSPGIDYSGTGLMYDIFWVIGDIPANSGQEILHMTVPNPTGITLTGMTPDPYIFYVQAVDGTGQTDGNTIEWAGTVH